MVRRAYGNAFHHVLRPALEGLRVEILDQICAGDKACTHTTVSGVHIGTLLGVALTGRAVTIEVMDLVRIRDGRFLEHRGINTLASVLAQLRAA
jgi:predicted ester cyclase